MDDAWTNEVKVNTAWSGIMNASHSTSCCSRATPIAPEAKPSNPKDIVGSNKVPLHLWPESASVAGSLALLEGALKYGRSNWRHVGVRATIYYDAARRHMDRWMEGEDTDPDSGLPHLWKALACVAILIDAGAAGKLNDDRNTPGGFENFLSSATTHVGRLKEQLGGNNVKHYTIEDQP